MHINSSKYQKIYIYIYIKVFHTIHQYYNYQDKKKEQNSRKHLPLVFIFFLVIFLTSLVKITAQPQKKRVNFLMGSCLSERTSRYDKILKVRIIHSIQFLRISGKVMHVTLTAQ